MSATLVNISQLTRTQEQCHPEEQDQRRLIHFFLKTVTHFFGGFTALFQGVTDPRAPRSPIPSRAWAWRAVLVGWRV